MSQPTGKRNTLYDQVLEHARREIDDASAEIDGLKRTLALLEARMEASKSVYEAVAARLNLEEEGNLLETAYLEAPPRLEEPEAEDSPPAEPVPTLASTVSKRVSTPVPTRPQPAPARAPEPTALPATPRPQADATAVDGNGIHSDAGGDVSMDLIRRHLEQRASRNQSELQVKPRPAPTIPAPPALEVAADSTSDDEDDDDSQPGARDPHAVGFPGLSDSDRRLIEEHMRRRAEANQNR